MANLGNIAEDEQKLDHFVLAILNRKYAAFDGDSRAPSGQEDGIFWEVNRVALLDDVLQVQGDRLARGLVEEDEELVERPMTGMSQVPARPCLSQGVEKRDSTSRVGEDPCFPSVDKRLLQPVIGSDSPLTLHGKITGRSAHEGKKAQPHEELLKARLTGGIVSEGITEGQCPGGQGRRQQPPVQTADPGCADDHDDERQKTDRMAPASRQPGNNTGTRDGQDRQDRRTVGTEKTGDDSKDSVYR